MDAMAERKRPFWLPTVAALVVVALATSAGIWQTNRAQFKRDLQARYDAQVKSAPVALPGSLVDAEAFRFRRISVTGQFDPAHEILLDNRVLNGKPGYHVVTPLKMDSAERYVLVDRGWVARGVDRTLLPEIRTPLGKIVIEGIAVPPSNKYLELSTQTVEGKVWQNLNMKRMADLLRYPVQPVVITQLNDNGDGLMRRWNRPDVGIEKHVGYAFQWFALAVATIVIYGVMYAKRRKQK
ncbi:MAG: SURF1 family protein [Burkholderiales bacterium]|nr:SURF1 family protein [Burkholderiales bacterium]